MMREALVEFIEVICEHQQLSRTTTHLTVYLLDRFMDAHNIYDHQLKLTALSCILLAGKLNFCFSLYIWLIERKYTGKIISDISNYYFLTYEV